jgi:outer membrane protein
MKNIAARPILLSLYAVAAIGAARAEQLPLWELGAGAAAISFPDYRGSDERSNYVLPIPYFVYRGEFLKADRQKIRGLFFKSERAEMDVSVNGSVPVKSKNNRARRGMPDLDPSLELGPSLNLVLFDSADKQHTLELRLPVRAVIASDFRHVDYQGIVFQPQLNLDNRHFLGHHGLNLGLAAGPLFADRRYHQFIYGVDAAYATAGRPAYKAHGGYAGTQFIAAMSKRFPSYWVGGFVKYDTLRGAAFDDSPLVKSKNGLTAGFGIAWVFAESKTRVEARD